MVNGRKRGVAGSCAWAAAVVCAAACANVLDLPEAPVLVAKDRFACRTLPAEPDAPTADRAIVHVHACNFVSTNCSTPVTGLTATLCGKRDVGCVAPIQVGIQDEQGDFTFEVPTGGVLGEGFDGYLRVTAPTGLCTDGALFGAAERQACALAPACDPSQPNEDCQVPLFVPALLFFNPPVTADLSRPVALPLIPSVASLSLPKAAGAQAADPSTGFVFVTALDCEGIPAAGVSFTLSPASSAPTGNLYLANGIVSASAQQTDASGIGGILGVPAGFARVVGSVNTPESGSVQIGSVGVMVEALAVTYVTLVPRP